LRAAATQPLASADGAGAVQGLDRPKRIALRQPHVKPAAKEQQRDSNENSFRWSGKILRQEAALSRPVAHVTAKRPAPCLLSGLRTRTSGSSESSKKAEVNAVRGCSARFDKKRLSVAGRRLERCSERRSCELGHWKGDRQQEAEACKANARRPNLHAAKLFSCPTQRQALSARLPTKRGR